MICRVDSFSSDTFMYAICCKMRWNEMDAGLSIKEIEGLGTGFRMNVVVLRLFSQSPDHFLSHWSHRVTQSALTMNEISWIKLITSPQCIILIKYNAANTILLHANKVQVIDSSDINLRDCQGRFEYCLHSFLYAGDVYTLFYRVFWETHRCSWNKQR